MNHTSVIRGLYNEAWLAAGEIGMRANDLWAEGRLSA